MKRFFSVATLFFGFLVLTGVAAAQTPWLDPAWAYRRVVTISNPSDPPVELTNYQVQVKLDSSFDYGNTLSGGSDVRVTSADGTTEIHFWIETWSPPNASIWVRVPSIPVAGTTICLYYGNSGASSASDGLTTFEAYDGFEDDDVGSAPTTGVIGAWAKYAGNPVIPNNGFGSTFYDGSIYHNFVNYGTINHYTSPDGITWTPDPANPVLTPTQPWEGSNVGVPMAWKEGDTWYMLYRAGSPNVIGLATSTDAVNWTHSANPVLVGDPGEWDSVSLDPWGVIKVGDTYYMWYNTIGSAPGQNGRCSGLATSTNLTEWTKDPNNPIFCGGRFCPFPFKYGDYYYLLIPHYTSGSDYSQHELYRDVNPTFYPGEREYLGVAIQYGPSDWDDHDQDTPAVLTDTIYRDTYAASNNQLWVYYAGEGGDGNWQTGMIIEEDIAAAIAGVNPATFSWSASGDITVVDDPVRQGVRSVRQRDTTTGSVILSGSIPSQASGAVSAWMRRSSNSAGDYDIYLYGEQLSCVAGLGRNGDFHFWNGAFQPTGILWAPNTWYLVTLAFDAATQRYDFTVHNEAMAELVRVEDIAFGRVSSMINSAQLYTSGGFIEDGFADDFRLRPWCGADASTSLGAEEPFNTAPIAEDQSVSTNEDSAIGIVLTASDADGDPLTYSVLLEPSHGILSGTAPSLTYTPNANYYGGDSFTFKVNDGTVDSNAATVTITVNSVNDVPVAEGDSYSTNEDTQLVVAAPGVLGNDSDVEGSALTAILASGPSHGALTLNPNGSFTYTPVGNYNGADSFTYRASDGSAQSDAATVSLTVMAVNDAPVAVNDGYTIAEDAQLTVPASGVLSNDSDPEGSPLTAVQVAGPSHGTLTLNANGSFTYTPGGNYNGSDSFTYRASDGSLQSGIATVNLTVTAVNDAPVAVDDSYSTDENTALTVPVPGVLGNDSDAESGSLTALWVSGPSHGTLDLNSDGSFTYTPALNYHGADSFTYRASDGSLQSDVATVSLSVTAGSTVMDDFNDNVKSRELWGPGGGYGKGVLTERNHRLEYTVSTPGRNGDSAYRDLIASQGTYTTNWEVQVDVFNGTRTSGSRQSSVGIEIFNCDNQGDYIHAELYAANGDKGFYAELGTPEGPANVNTGDLGGNLPLAGSLRVSFNSTTKVITLYYDISDTGGDWIQFGSFGISGVGGDDADTDWLMTEEGQFCFDLYGNSRDMAIASGKIYADNFEATGVTAPVVIHVLEPNGSEPVPAGEPIYPVSWEAPLVATQFKLEYSLDNGTTWKPMAQGLVTDRSHDWQVPVPKSNKRKCLVKVTGLNEDGDKIGTGISELFTIEVASITAPAEGAIVPRGTPDYLVTWETNGIAENVDKVKVFYTLGNSGIWKRAEGEWVDPLDPLVGFLWDAPSPATPKNAKLKVVFTDASGNILATAISSVFRID